MKFLRILRPLFGMILLCMLTVSMPMNAQFRASAMRDDFKLLEQLATNTDREAYERQFEAVVAAAQKRGDDNAIFDAYGNKASYYLRRSDVKLNSSTLNKMKAMAEARHSDYGMMIYLLTRAMSLTAQTLPDEALRLLDEAIAICERHPGEPLFNSAYAYSQKGQTYLVYPKYDEAIAETETAVRMAGDDLILQRNPHISLFRLYMSNNERLKEGKEHMDWILQNFPQDEMSHYERETFQFSSVLYYLYLNDTESAQKVVDQMIYNIIRIDCQRRIYECNKDYSSAIVAFQHYMDQNDSVVADLVEQQINQYDNELAAKELDANNARLAQANHQLKLEQDQRDTRILALKQEAHAQRLQTLNHQLNLEHQQQELEDLQTEQDKRNARIEQEKRQARNKLLSLTVASMAVLLLLLLFFGALLWWVIRAFRRQKAIAEQEAKNAEEANLMKSRILQNMNHDLRAPLAAIVSVVDLLNMTDIEISDEDRTQLVEGLRMQSDLLLQLVDDIIDLSALQSGEYHLEYKDVDLNKLCANAIMSFKNRCAEGVEMRVELPKEGTVMNTDYKRVLEVISNLLSNAAKYTDQGSIVLSYETRPDEVEFSVTDTGKGIPESQAKSIFDRFEMIGSVKKGFGLGLSICQSVVTLMKGRIWLDTTYKSGARFCFTLPRIIILLCLFGWGDAKAQDNPYHIDDKAYEYVKKYLSHQDEAHANRYIDSLMIRGRAVNDLKAQCIGMHLYTDHLYMTNASDQEVRKASARCVAFCRNTPYTQYVFSSWNYQIQRLLDQGLYMNALKELNAYNTMADELHSAYGKSRCMTYMGRTYENLRQNAKAVAAYRDAIRAQQQSGDTTNIATLYLDYGDCLRRMREYECARSVIDCGLNACYLPQARLLLLLSKADCLYHLKDSAAMKRTLQQIDETNSDNSLSNINLSIYHDLRGKYYVLCGDVESAQREVNQITHDNIGGTLRRDLLMLKGDSFAAFQDMVAECQRHGEENRRITELQFREFSKSMENTQRELEQERLRLRNTEMMLEKVRQEKQLLALETEDDSLRVVYANASLEVQESDRKLHRQREAYRQAAQKEKDEQERQSFRINALLIISMAIGLLVVILALRRLWKLRRNISRERQAAFQARQQAEHAAEDMSLFMHAMNHEIRTPLNAIIGFTDILNQPTEFGLQEEERAQLMENLHTQTQNIQQMVNTILDISKMESGTYIFSPEPTMLHVLAEQALETIRMKVAPGVEIINKVEPSEATYLLDNNRMHILLTHMLSNAQKNTTQGSITLSMQWEDGMLRIDVEDTGCGIPQEFQPRIFERFSKVNPFDDGFGLGLPFSRVIAEKMGGSLWLVKSDTSGTHFAAKVSCPEE